MAKVDLGFKVRSGKVEGTLAFVPTDALEVDRVSFIPFGIKPTFFRKSFLLDLNIRSCGKMISFKSKRNF